MRNTGKSSEGQFVASYEKAGAFVHRFFDAAEIYGRNGGRTANVPPQPADHLVVYDGEMFLAEVKSTSSEHRFDFSMIRPPQHAAGIKTIRHDGRYYVFAHHLPTNRWYRIPYEVIREAGKTGKKSMYWDELETFAWELPQ